MIESTVPDGQENGAALKNLHNFFKWFCSYKIAYPNIYKVLAAALTLGTSTATCEAGFSTVVRILTPYRRCMGQNRKCQLVYLAFEKEETEKLSDVEVFEEYRKKLRKMFV